MVAAEAAATGALPVSAHHSGAAEVSSALAAELPATVGRLLSFELDEDAVAAIAERLDGWLALAAPRARAGERGAARDGRAAVELARGGAHRARRSAGELDGLPVPRAA